jgi:type I restriction enzyme S subunit
MGEFRFSLPPIEIQRSIAATLRALDDKIESNRRAMEVSEELADAIFSTWSSTAVPLAGVALLTMGNSPPGSSYNEEGFGMPFYQGVRDFGRRFPDRRVWTTEPLRRAEVNDTLVSVRAPVGDLNRASETCCIGRGVASVRSTTPSTIYYALRAASDLWEPFQHEGTVFGAINQADLATAKIPWPDDGSLAGVESDLAAIDAWIESLSRATSRLTSLRDMLLPALLSGSVPVTATGTEL